MKKNYLKLNVWAMVACMGLFCLTSCSDDDNGGNGGDDGSEEEEIVIEDGATLSGNVTNGQTVRLSQGRSFQLSGGYTVENGGTLIIERGVTITAVRDDNPDYILIAQGGYIDAQGSAEEPIVMTANLNGGELRTAGWGGIHICGKSHTNRGEGTLSEIGESPYGGTDEADDSGILKYIRLEYTGFALDSEHEANGLSLYGVGSGTTIENIAIYKGGDDGIEFFGGSVNVKYAVVIDCEDDSYDWTEGWNGHAQFLVASQTGTTGAKDNGDCLMECDNNGENVTLSPISHPILSNLTLIGNNSTEGDRGIRLRAGTEVEIYNSLIVGKPRSITIETPETDASFSKAENPSVLEYIACSGSFDNESTTTEGTPYTATYTEDLFLTANNELNTTIPSFTNGFVGTVDGGIDPTTLGSFFEAASYKGAVAANAGWIEGNWIRQ